MGSSRVAQEAWEKNDSKELEKEENSLCGEFREWTCSVSARNLSDQSSNPMPISGTYLTPNSDYFLPKNDNKKRSLGIIWVKFARKKNPMKIHDTEIGQTQRRTKVWQREHEKNIMLWDNSFRVHRDMETKEKYISRVKVYLWPSSPDKL